jgi:hypothetical protein
MLVFTAYDRRVEASPEQAELLRLFDFSWEKHGWETRVIPIDTPFRPGRPFRIPEQELHIRRARVFAPWWLMNLGSRSVKGFKPVGGIRVVKPDGVFIVEVKTVAEAEALFARQ